VDWRRFDWLQRRRQDSVANHSTHASSSDGVANRSTGGDTDGVANHSTHASSSDGVANRSTDGNTDARRMLACD